jgi:hypothetical protein
LEFADDFLNSVFTTSYSSLGISALDQPILSIALILPTVVIERYAVIAALPL